MKILFSKIRNTAPLLIAALAVGAAKLFAGMPCLGPYYEPELPEELRK